MVPTNISLTSTSDPGSLTAGTLRYAINEASTDAAAGTSDTITFSGLNGQTITLAHRGAWN